MFLLTYLLKTAAQTCCGYDYQMCLNQKCVSVSSIDAPDCGNCSMHGVSYLPNIDTDQNL